MRTKGDSYPDYTAEIAAVRENGITLDLLHAIIEKHSGNREYNRKLYARYRCVDDGVPIFGRQPKYPDEEGESINNKVNNDFFSEIVDIKTGYFAGKAISYSYSTTDESEGDTGGEVAVDEAAKALSDFVTRNNMYDVDMETTKLAAMYGYCGRLFYADPDGAERVMPVHGYETIVLSNTSITEPEYAIRYYSSSDLGGKEVWNAEFYDSASVKYYSGEPGALVPGAEKAHFFGACPLQGIPNNNELLGDAEKVLNLVDDYDKVVSDNSNEIESFVHALMAIENINIPDDEIRKMQTTGSISYYSGANQGKIYFVTKEINDAFTEHHLQRLEGNIYRFSKTPNLGDESFGTASGVSLKFKLTGLETKCGMFQAKMQTAGVYMFKLLARIWAARGLSVDPLQCFMGFKRNFPLDLAAEAQTVQQLIAAGLPKEVAFEQLSFIDDVGYVMALLEAEMDGVPLLEGDDGVDIDATAGATSTLNGAQITAFMGIIQNMKDGVLSREAAITLAISTLGVSRENAEAIIEEQV